METETNRRDPDAQHGGNENWAELIEQSRKNNTNMLNLFGTTSAHQETFTERFRLQAEESCRELERMEAEMGAAVREVENAGAQAVFPRAERNFVRPPRRRGTPVRLTAPAQARYFERCTGGWYLVTTARHYARQRYDAGARAWADFRALLSNTKKLLEGAIGLTRVIDRLAAEGLAQNTLLLYEEELKSLAHKVNELYQQINRSGFHLYGMFAKEKEIAVNICLKIEEGPDMWRHHQAVLWAHGQYLRYRATGNQYLLSATEALDVFMQALRKEIMRRKVDAVHVSVRDIERQRREMLAEHAQKQAARAEMGEEWEDEMEAPELPTLAAVESVGETVDTEAALALARREREEKDAAADAAALAEQEFEDTANEEYGDDEEHSGSIVPLIILVLILAGVGYYYFFMKG